MGSKQRQISCESDGLAGVGYDPLNLAAFLNNWVASQCVGTPLCSVSSQPSCTSKTFCSAQWHHSPSYKCSNTIQRLFSPQTTAQTLRLPERPVGKCFPLDFGFPSTETMPLCCQLSLPSSPWKSEISARRFIPEKGAWECGKDSSHSRGKCDERDLNNVNKHTHRKYSLVKNYKRVLGTLRSHRQAHPHSSPLRQADTHSSWHTNSQRVGNWISELPCLLFEGAWWAASCVVEFFLALNNLKSWLPGTRASRKITSKSLCSLYQFPHHVRNPSAAYLSSVYGSCTSTEIHFVIFVSVH